MKFRVMLPTPNDAGGSVVADAPATFADAGAKFLSTLTPEQRETEFPGLDDTDDLATQGDDIDQDIATEGAQPDPITRDDGATWNVEAGRWKNTDGSFATGTAPEGAPSKRAPVAATPAPVAAATADDEQWVKVKLPAIVDGEEALEIETADPAIVKRLAQLSTDAGRGRALQKRIAALDQQQAEFQEIDDALSTDPVGFVLRQMSPERRVEIGRAILLEHFDELANDVATYQNDPTARANERLHLRDRMTETSGQVTQQRQLRDHATKCIRAAEGLIPDGTDDDAAGAFIADARRDLADLASRGQRVTPDTVPQLLARRAQMYGFSHAAAPAPASSSSPAPAASSAAPAARPISDRARDVASRVPDKQAAERAQSRIRQVQANRNAATRVAPAGAGAAPVQVPILPPEAETSVKAASKHLRAKGFGSRWHGRRLRRDR
jgi:hypothetical protein